MDALEFKNKCCSLDLEVNERGQIFAIGARLQGKTFYRSAPFECHKVLAEFDLFSADASFLLGHNLLGHDLPICRTLTPGLDFLNKPVIDTLFLSPIAFPENPYHRLVKNYKLVRDSLNDPLADARIAEGLFQDQWNALQGQYQQTGLLSFYHFAFSENEQFSGLKQALECMGADDLDGVQAFDLFKQLTRDKVCTTALDSILDADHLDSETRPALAYCLAWLMVAGGNSVLPPWVREKFQNVAPLLHQLREVPCNRPECSYCEQTHNPVTQLERYFGFSAFRPKPQAHDGSSLQQAIVQAAMSDMPLFAVLPTGGGKSLCYQLPALIRYQRRGVLTIVISPLQALMKDQVDNLRNKTGTYNVAALNGLLTTPERGEVLQGIRMGDIAVLYVSPEQLRNRSFQKAIEHREIGCWVFDEAHCLSKWGHDFRPDYLYAARFIEEFARKQHSLLPAVQCFTATAKQDVKEEIIDYFRSNLGLELRVFEGGVERNNLQFEVQTVNQADKYPRINLLLAERLDDHEQGGSAIIYCAKRQQTEDIAEFLQQQDWSVEAFHAGKNAAEKKHIQDNFIKGTTRIITATNAFGMGIDKDNVRLVIHADIPGSLENYLQEAGRAGRDQKNAECILLYSEDDLETQFKLSATSEIRKRDIAQILRGLRYSKKDEQGNVVITTGELLMDEAVDTSFAADDYNAATRVITAISWLERAGFIERNENRTQVFQGRPMVENLNQAEDKINKLGLSARQRRRWLAILEELMNADVDEGFSADQLAQLSAFKEDESESQEQNVTASQRVIRTLYDMTEAGLIKKNLLLSAYIRHKVANSSQTQLRKICALEMAMLQMLPELAPDAETGEWQILSLRHLNQGLLDQNHTESNPEILRLLLGSLARDGQGLAGKKGSLTLRYKGLDQYWIKLNRGWKALVETARRRQSLAVITLQSIIDRIPDPSVRAADLLIEFAAEDLLAALKTDAVAAAQIKDPLAAIERSLNFMHELKIITLQKGLAVFRQAMTIQVLPEATGRRYGKGDYEPLAHYYSERVFQVHVINEYARRGLEKIGQALAFVVAYFTTDKIEFVQRYFSDREEILQRATSQQSFQRIVGDLHNPQQIALVSGHEDDNQLILAGPGSGKTRVVVHRCAYLLRVKRIQPKAILILCFNRNAVTELRKRLIDLVGDDAKGVTIQTYHGLSLRLTGHAMTGEQSVTGDNGEQKFTDLISEAIALLRGEKPLLGIEEDAVRERLLAGFRFILVDEYQDIDEQQYQLVSALAGRTLDEDSKLSILAVGDDDQNIYQFRGANIGFIRQFEKDYQAQIHYLVENYRSSAHIISASNQLIQQNRDRMKQAHPIRINAGRKNLEAGGRWQKLDALAKGRVQIIGVADEVTQARETVTELQRLKQLDARLEWAQCAVLAKEWRLLNPVRSLLESHDIPVRIILPSDRKVPVFRVREVALLLDAVRHCPDASGTADDWLEYLHSMVAGKDTNIWIEKLKAIMLDWQRETDHGIVPTRQTLEFLYETLSEQRREQVLGTGVFLGTIHAVKGLEFNHLLLLDGGWTRQGMEEQRRLFYVAMTRAKETLCLMQRQDLRNPFLPEIHGQHVLRRQGAVRNDRQNTQCSYQYAFLGLQDFDLSYAGSFAAENRIHRYLADLCPGHDLTLCNNRGKLVLTNGQVTIAVLSKSAHSYWLPLLDTITKVTVIAMIRRFRDDSEQSYRNRCKVEQWDVPMVEVQYRAQSVSASSSVA